MQASLPGTLHTDTRTPRGNQEHRSHTVGERVGECVVERDRVGVAARGCSVEHCESAKAWVASGLLSCWN